MQSSPNHHALLSLIYAFHSCLNKVILIFSRHTVSFHLLSKFLKFWVELYAYWSPFWTHFDPFWTHFEFIFDQVLSHFRPISDSFRTHFWSIFDRFRTHFGPILDPLWTHYEPIFDRISLYLIQYLVIVDHYDNSNNSCYSTKAGFQKYVFWK